MNIYCAVVVYNKECTDSTTCESMKDIKNINVILLDNSTIKTNNIVYCENVGWTYMSMNGNKGLAKAYNRAIDIIPFKDSILCLFDDDSKVTDDYFIKLREAFKEQKDKDILLPFIFDHNGLLSPSIIDGLIISRADDISGLEGKEITGVNSGMAIRSEILENYRYDERYFLDYIDHVFLRDMRNRGYNIGYFEAKFQHETFFGLPDTPISAIRKRLKIFKKDFRRFCGSSFYGFKVYQREMYELKKHFMLTHKNWKDWIKIIFI